MTARRALAMGLWAVVLSRCNCDDKITGTEAPLCERSCETTADCEQCGKNRHECVDGVCVEQPRACNAEGECCPGESCNPRKFCADRYTTCTLDADCAVPGQVCRQFTTYLNTTAMRCTFDRCTAQGGCGAGLTCFAGYCVGADAFTVSKPGKTRLCGGGCPATEVCVPVNGRCMKPPPECQVQSCGPGTALTFTDPDNVDDDCDLAKRQCGCVELPPLISTDLGRYSSLAVTDQGLLVSMYDGTFGDLVLSRFTADGARLSTEYLDGVPSTGVIIAAPSGPRAGVADPGDDVGRYTSMVTDAAGNPYISYYDGTHGDLKIAYKTAGAWNIHVIDGGVPANDVGMFTSIALIGGKPAIAYFQRAGAGAFELQTALKFAWAQTATPASSADWLIRTLDVANRPAPPCWSPKCGTNEVCVAGGANGTCKSTSTSCNPACKSSEVCVVGAGGTPACETFLAGGAIADLPEGVGLFPSLAAVDGAPVVAYYDRLTTALKGVQGDTGGTFATPIFLDGKPPVTGADVDVGLYPSLVVDSTGSLSIAYQDATHDDLLYWNWFELDEGVFATTIDDGVSEPGSGDLRMVGADAAMVVTAAGTFYVAYQDQTKNNLRVRMLQGADWVPVLEISEGAVGFFVNAVARADKLFLSHVKIRSTPAGLEDTILFERLDAP